MPAQRGKDLLLKVDETGAGSFLTVAGLRSRRLQFASATVDASDADSPERWRELLAGAGLKRASLSGSGIFRDAASDGLVRGLFFAGIIRTWQVILPGLGTLAGPFQIAGLDYAGDHDGEVTFEIALESAGLLTFTAA
jgi:TP901-1 family phage major tail protein